jgi:GNAT superfamily N-acetyltransferase
VANNMDPLQFREARISDEAVLFPLMRKLAEQEPGKVKFDEGAAQENFRKRLALPQFSCIWLFFENGQPVGYSLTIGFSFKFQGYDAFVDEGFVSAPFGRRGYRRQAVPFLEPKARGKGMLAPHLEVDQGNAPAFELSRRAGYESHNRFLMTKRLV